MSPQPLALVVENDAGTRKLLNVLLTRFGFEVDLVANGTDALVLLQHVEYSVVFIDLLLPGANGSDILRWIERSRPDLLRRAIVLSSAPEMQLERVRTLWPSVLVIRKPFELGEVVESARELTEGFVAKEHDRATELCRRSLTAGAKGVVVVQLRGKTVMPTHAFGYEPQALEPYFPIDIDAPLPICTAMRNGRPLWIGSAALAYADYPALVSAWEQRESRALCIVPLRREGGIEGAIGWSFREPHLFSENEQQVFLAIAQLATQLLPEAGDKESALSAGA